MFRPSLALLLLSTSLAWPAHAATSRLHQVDLAPIAALPDLGPQFLQLQRKFQTEALSSEEHKKRMAIAGVAIKNNPNWYDGYALVAAEAFFLGSNFTSPHDHHKAKVVLEEGEAATIACLKKDPNNLLCKFFKASLRAKIASFDGILASLKHGQAVRDTWIEVVKSGIDMPFRPNVSLQGSAHYGLGLFYRLVPNFFLMDWLFKIRGNIDESITMHRQAMQFDNDNPCYQLMLSVSLLCKVKGRPQTPEYKEAMQLLEAPARTKAIDIAQAACVHDVPKIRAHPDHVCGYTQAKYQDDVDETDLTAN